MPEQACPSVTCLNTTSVVWFSSATGALIASLEALGVSGKWVAVPPNICPNVIVAVLAAGCRPWFVDIESERQGIDPARLSEVISQVGAVIAVHAYGTPCKIDEIIEVAHRAGVPVIEDCAQADGAVYKSVEVGTFGDISVFSFGKGKIVDAGGGGLAITQEARWKKRMELVVLRWADNPDLQAGDNLGNAYRFFYNRFYPERTELVRESFFSLLKALAPRFKNKCKPDRIPELCAARDRRKSLVDMRRDKYRAYIKQLSGIDHIAPLPLYEGAAPWRFNAIVDANRRDQVFHALIKSGRNASTWYPRIARFLPESEIRSGALLVSEYFERVLLNLWVDEKVSINEIESQCDKIKYEVR